MKKTNWFNKFAKNVDNTQRLEGPIFVITLFSVSAMIFSQTAFILALKMRFGGG